MNAWFELVARVCLAVVFLGSAVNKIGAFAGTAQFMATRGLPAASLLLAAAIACELGGGLSLVLGVRARLGAVALILFLIPTTLLFHVEPGNQDQTIHAMKNLAILGGLAGVAVHGAGRLSLDARVRSGRAT